MRLVGQSKMGFYPAPPITSSYIANALTRSGPGPILALDPCCGEGTALLGITAPLGAPVETYGIELNHARAATAREKLTRVLRADIRDVRAANGAFGVLFLNPPYDFDAKRDLDEAAQRLELYWLQACLRYLQPAGVLVYLIPDKRLSPRIAAILAYHLERLAVYRFPQEEYDRFRQIVVFGARKARPFRDETVANELARIGQALFVPPALPEALGQPYAIPIAPQRRNVLFQSLAVDPEDLTADLEKHGLYPVLHQRLYPPDLSARMRPIMPLRRGHLALVLASGYLNNELVTDPDTGQQYLVKGRTEKDVVKTEEKGFDGDRVITERDVLKIVVTALDLHSGALETMQ